MAGKGAHTSVYVQDHIAQCIHLLDEVWVAVPGILELREVFVHELIGGCVVPGVCLPTGMYPQTLFPGGQPFWSEGCVAEVDMVESRGTGRWMRGL